MGQKVKPKTTDRRGRPSKGARHAQTIRFPIELHQRLKEDADAVGADFQEYVVSLCEQATQWGANPRNT